MIEKYKLTTIGALLILGVLGYVYLRPIPTPDSDTMTEVFDDSEKNEGMMEGEPAEMMTDSKEFAMDAFYDSEGMWFSLKEISVNKGDNVKITVKNVKGNHNFNIDEYAITSDLPLDEEVVIEFVADKAGEFVYYCSVPGHREKGQWGTLKVNE